ENTVRATYRLPYLAHTTMEPMNATASVHDGGVTVWVPTQAQGSVQQAAAEVAGVSKDKVVVHTTFLGGDSAVASRPTSSARRSSSPSRSDAPCR
ncbi:MAG TPA: hypothetical protein ENO19_05865, partial [Halothiobacillaceae bacterium]|nr:hypothetical protein [Halothiobacillaceae bacterium]